jgi:ParB family chromosome partitioning protein
LSKGITKTEIAKSIGKSGAYVKQHVTLLDLPDPIADIYNRNRCQDITLINDLVTMYKAHPEEVTAWIGDEEQEINRGSVKLFREFLLEQNRAGKPITKEQRLGDKKPKPATPEKLKRAVVRIEIHGRSAQLILNRRPSRHGLAWMKYEETGEEFEAELHQVKLVAVVEGTADAKPVRLE